MVFSMESDEYAGDHGESGFTATTDDGESGFTATTPEFNDTDLRLYDEENHISMDRRWDDWLDVGEIPAERNNDDSCEDVIDVNPLDHGNAEIIQHDNVEWLRVGLDVLNNNDYIQIIQRSHQKYDVNPTTYVPVSVPLAQSPSTVLFVMEKEDLCDVGDLTRDCFSPWACIEKGECKGTTAECKWYLFDKSGVTRHFRNKRDLLKADEKAALWITTQRLSRCLALKRTVAAIYNLSVLPATGKRSKEALMSNVLVAYSFEGGEPPEPTAHGNSRGSQIHAAMRPSSADLAYEMLKTQGVAETARAISEMRGIPVKRHQVSYVKSINPEKFPRFGGRQERDCVQSLRDAARNHNAILKEFTRQKVRDVGGVQRSVDETMFVILCPDAMSMFRKQGCSPSQIALHRTECEEALTQGYAGLLQLAETRTIQNGPEQGLLSQTCMKGALMVDFTFSTCSMQLGVLAYPSTMFRRTTGSAKQPYVEFGYVLCPVPDSETMAWLGMELNKEFTRIDPLFRVSALITDREKALRQILKGGIIFEGTIELHCAVHWKQNCLTQCGPAAAGSAYNYIFGSENVVGLLDSATSSQEFDDQMRGSIIPILPLRAQGKTWLEGQIAVLWEHYSLVARLKAGFGLHAVTTNSIENINRWLHEDIGPRNSIQAVVSALLSRNRDIMRSFLGAVLGCSSDFSPRFGLREMTYLQAKTATYEDKYVAAKQYGLEDIVGCEQRDLQLPQFIFDGRSGVSRDTFLAAVRRTKIYPHPDVCLNQIFIAEDGDQAVSYKVNTKDGDIACGCMRSRFSPFCHHIAAYVINLPEGERAEHWRILSDKRKESADDRRNRLANASRDGRKPSKRRGAAASASNHVRKYACRRPLANVSMDSPG